MEHDKPANANPGSSGSEVRGSDAAIQPPSEGSRTSRRRTGLGLVVGLLVLAALAAVGARGLPEQAADRGPAPIDVTGAAVAEFLAWALIVLAVGVLVFTFWPSGPRRRLPERPKVSVFRFLVMVGVVMIVMSIFRAGLLDEESAPEADEPVTEQVATESGRSRWAIALLVGALAATLGGLALVGLRRGGDRDPDEFSPGEPRQSDPEAEEPSEAAGAAGLLAGPHRAAIVRRYGTMLGDLADAGHARRPSEAPFEYLNRIEPSAIIDEPARRLTRLFERAGFSVRPVTEDMIADADTALGDVRRNLDEFDE